MNSNFFTELKALIAKHEAANNVAEQPVQWTPKKGDLAEVISVDDEDLEKGIEVGEAVQVDEEGTDAPICIRSNGKRRVLYVHQLRHLPDYQPKPKLATTYEEVVEAVKPLWYSDVNGSIIKYTFPDPYQLPTEQSAKQDAAFRQIKNLEAYCAGRFEGEMAWAIGITNDGELFKTWVIRAPFFFTEEAADFVIEHFSEIFKTYFGIDSTD